MRNYIKTFSKREILSALFSSLMFVSFFYLFKNVNVNDTYHIITFLILSLPIIISHRFYYIEHKRRNRISGRVIHDFIICFITFLLLVITLKISGVFHLAGYYSNLIFFVFASIYFTELALTLLNRAFILFGWRIW